MIEKHLQQIERWKQEPDKFKRVVVQGETWLRPEQVEMLWRKAVTDDPMRDNMTVIGACSDYLQAVIKRECNGTAKPAQDRAGKE